MFNPELSFTCYSEKLACQAYYDSESSALTSALVSRLAAATLSVAAAVDLIYHGTSLLFTCLYAIGSWLYEGDVDMTIPWQHLERVRNAVAPLLFGTITGLLHPLIAIAVSEPANKHAVVGILAANTEMNSLETPCSPVQSLSMIKEISDYYRHVEFNDGKTRELFPEGYGDALTDALENEKSLELMHALELVHSASNLCFKLLSKLQVMIDESSLSPFFRQAAHRLSGLLIPLVMLGDLLSALVVQSFFLMIGVVQLATGRTPIYLEMTGNPLLHLELMAQTLVKWGDDCWPRPSGSTLQSWLSS